MDKSIGTVHSGLKVFAKNRANDVAVVCENQSLTFKELNLRVNALANSLIDLGIKKGDHIALYMRNCIEMVEIFYAISSAGAVLVPLNYMLDRENLAELINKSDAKYIFINQREYPKLEEIADKLEVINNKSIIVIESEANSLCINYEDLVESGSPEDPKVEVASEDLFAILFSSGTTSSPKGSKISHGTQVYRQLRTYIERSVSNNDVVLITVPMYYSIGFSFCLWPGMMGSKIVITKEFNTIKALELIEEHGVSQAFFVPTQYNTLLQEPSFDKFDLSSLRQLSSSGAPLSKELKNEIIARFNCKLFEFFGSTETASYIIMHPENVVNKTGSIGQQVNYMEVRLLNEQGKEVDIGEDGEFVVRGPLLFDGYYNQPEETAKSYLPGGWFCTGDMGKMDEEGYYYLLDRKKDMIISGGINIYSKDIEQVIQSHHSVFETAVVGIPDQKWGEAVKAFIVLHQEQSVSKDELMQYFNNKLARFQKIKEIEIITSLPRTASGKVLKRELRNYQYEHKK
ncbi:class I adenylate-forming enzyme family protein [Sporosarcina sp. P33]|uniref:class I adenylate-forming enzyme family protein n=1 Tax=Sporosarcina sp. P33 TaxID=1930764 RepID=UPI0009C0DC1F|nr:class I adenylate-forming enzyme family protein [Sporosarcina sp. P33]ARD47055.1 hypothetical protein SporoP33_01545 [Sporosarcina sp. P33]